MREVYCINWTEYERGWGTRPDGHTLHTTKQVAIDYIAAYRARHHTSQHAPDEYSSPDEPFAVMVDFETYDRVKKEGSIWGHHSRWLAPVRNP